MKISFNWLKERLPLSLSAEQLAERMPQLGFEVASIEKRGPAFTGVVTAQILQIDKHPNADRLSLCVVEDGTGKVSVVCGAKNIAVGQKIPFARVGAVLPGDFKITKSKIRGVESNGMICSAEELGIGKANGGILVLDPSISIGKDFASMLGPADDVLEVEITPNRPDCLSHLGLARELAVFLKTPLVHKPLPALSESGECPRITIKDPLSCPRYVGRLITGVKVAESPAWLKAKLEAVGLRPINNVVDVTNLILMDMGQPLHAFDLQKLSGPEIVVRAASKGERIKALDGKTYDLTDANLVIADAQKPVAIAGVMGGEETGVTEATTSVLLESAYFAPPAVRKSGQKLRLRSDSSYRFERGVDPGAVEEASARAAALIAELTGGKASTARAAGEAYKPRPAISFTSARINRILGSEFSEKEILGVLSAIGAISPHEFSAPSHRGDLETVWDLAEEVGRLLGYDAIPSRIKPFTVEPSAQTPMQTLGARLRQRLVAQGFFEAYNYDLIARKELTSLGMAAEGLVELANPLSEDWALLRPSLLPSLLRNAVFNKNRGAKAARLFELGKIYGKAEGQVTERWRLAGVMLGPVAPAFWKAARTPDADFHDLKGVIEDLVAGLPGVKLEPRGVDPHCPNTPLYHPGAAMKLTLGKEKLGDFGLLHPRVARALDLDRQPVGVFNLKLDVLLSAKAPATRFTPFSVFPSVERDLSFFVDAKRLYAELESAIREAAGAELRGLSLIDLFAGKGVPEGKRSLTVRLVFSREDRTLTDPEVNQAVDAAIKALEAAGAILRK